MTAPGALTELFFRPPLAIGRLGGSPVPVEAFLWTQDSSRYGAGRTAIEPALSFEIDARHVPRPYVPSVVHFADEHGIRPAAPFFELWATVDRGGTSVEEAVTLALLDELHVDLTHVTYELTLANRKAARRSGDAACGFAAYGRRNAADFGSTPMLASSTVLPGNKPLVFPDRPIPLGVLWILRPVAAIEDGVDLSILRVRFVPPKGLVYGPPSAIASDDPSTRRRHEIVAPQNRILNQDAAWCLYDGNYRDYDNPEPADTYDGADVNQSVDANQSWGVVDDTSDGILHARLQHEGAEFVATARVAVAPPDYAPDRRFFLTLADDLSDREASLINDPTAEEVTDLFQRIFETLSLQNVDYTRDRALAGNSGYSPTHPETPPRTDYGSLTHLDKVNDELYAIKTPPQVPQTPTDANGIPVAPPAGTYTTVARGVHEPLADQLPLLDFLRANGGRVRTLLRPPWASFTELDDNLGVKQDAQPRRDPRRPNDQAFDMRMPPYMRDESPFALSLTRREYLMIMAFLDLSERASKQAKGIRPAAVTDGPDERLLGSAERHLRNVVLRRRTASKLPKA
jgi:hypothetical protein